jgi:glycosyltransferase involved in cell wall biosynthesis
MTICALTYKRPDGLARLLEGLKALRFRDEPPDARIVVVDNDPAGSARETCRQMETKVPCPLKYVIETQRGIAFARNAALDNALDSEWICFIDDDEVPDPHWLDSLLAVQRQYDADVVGGPVVPRFLEPVPHWIEEGGFFNRRRFPTGRRLRHAFTNNVLFRSRILDELKLRFNERWALMGCEDRAFFQTIGMAGYKIVWADEAEVTEWVPSSRANAEWLVRRHYRVGNSTSFVELDLRSKWQTWPLLLAKSAVWLALGTSRLALSPFRGQVSRVRGMQGCAYAAGLFTGLLGIAYEEYRRTHSV